MNQFQYHNDQLHAEGVPLTRIARDFGTPCFVYSRAALEENFHAYQQALAGCEHLICYAVKANDNLAVLGVLARLGSGFDIVSGGELERVLAAGGDPAKIIFSGVGKTVAEINRALDVGIHCFNVESPAELERLDALARAAGKVALVSLRINPDVDAGTHPYISTGLKENKFGISIDEAPAIYRRARDMDGLEVIGVDCHIGSQLTSIAPFIDSLDRLLLLTDSLAEDGIRLRHLDIGGGLGVRYRDETPPAAGELIAAVRERLAGRSLTLVLEPGRSICANAGVMLTRVEYLKSNGGKHFAIIDGAMNDIIRPALYQSWMNVLPVAGNTKAESRTYDLVGPICESADFIARDRTLALAQDDLLAVCSAGAYSFVMSSNYNARNRAPEILVSGERIHVARRRETYQDQMALETPLED